jgi:putative phosphoribosyl transferase
MASMKSVQAYRDRREAGEILAAHMWEKIGTPEDAVVLALPRGGLPIGFEVALTLGAELEVFVVRKLGAPTMEEYAIGAIATGGFQILNDEAIAQLNMTESEIAEVAERETEELHRRETLYRANRPPMRVENRVAILVDDGLATGFTMRAAIAAVRARHPQRLVVAAPVGARETCREIEREADILICPLRPESFHAVGLWYHDFSPTTDDEVRECLVVGALNYETANHSPRR